MCMSSANYYIVCACKKVTEERRVNPLVAEVNYWGLPDDMTQESVKYFAQTVAGICSATVTIILEATPNSSKGFTVTIHLGA